MPLKCQNQQELSDDQGLFYSHVSTEYHFPESLEEGRSAKLPQIQLLVG